MGTHVTVNGLGLTHKGSVGTSIATLPDVCKTPTPGGPVPMPYPNVADHGTLKGGTTTVKIKGNMIANKPSEYGSSIGDEPGTVGGVTSNTFKKETAWISYSFNVKMDGANACRNTDKKFHNHKNTVDLAGNLDPAVKAAFEAALCDIVKTCEDAVNNHFCGGPPSAYDCNKTTGDGKRYSTFLGDEKDKCVKKAIKERQKDKDPSVPPGTTTPEYPKDLVNVPGGGKCLPDIMVGTPPNCDAVYDIKTKCPANGKAPEWPTYYDLPQRDCDLLRARKAPNKNYNGKTQADIYKDSCGVQPTMIHPYSDNCQ
jgi:Domain of unknown function (DUF4150)